MELTTTRNREAHMDTVTRTLADRLNPTPAQVVTALDAAAAELLLGVAGFERQPDGGWLNQDTGQRFWSISLAVPAAISIVSDALS